MPHRIVQPFPQVEKNRATKKEEGDGKKIKAIRLEPTNELNDAAAVEDYARSIDKRDDTVEEKKIVKKESRP